MSARMQQGATTGLTSLTRSRGRARARVSGLSTELLGSVCHRPRPLSHMSRALSNSGERISEILAELHIKHPRAKQLISIEFSVHFSLLLAVIHCDCPT